MKHDRVVKTPPKPKLPPNFDKIRCPIDGGTMRPLSGRIMKCKKCGFLGRGK